MLKLKNTLHVLLSFFEDTVEAAGLVKLIMSIVKLNIFSFLAEFWPDTICASGLSLKDLMNSSDYANPSVWQPDEYFVHIFSPKKN